MTDRLHRTFSALKSEDRAALVTYLMAGDPSVAQSLEILKALPDAGADIVELGMPFSDPAAEGQTIQAAGERSLACHTKMKDVLAMVRDFRTQHPETPLILMGYYNPIYRYGAERFCHDASEAGVDGLIVVDLPVEEEEELRIESDRHGLHIIRLLTPTSDEARLPMLMEGATGFAYYVAIAGITGTKSADYKQLEARFAQLRHVNPSLPLAIGFGIKSPEQVQQAAQYADAVVVGSALVDVIAKEKTAAAAAAFVTQLAAATKRNPQKAAG